MPGPTLPGLFQPTGFHRGFPRSSRGRGPFLFSSLGTRTAAVPHDAERHATLWHDAPRRIWTWCYTLSGSLIPNYDAERRTTLCHDAPRRVLKLRRGASYHIVHHAAACHIRTSWRRPMAEACGTAAVFSLSFHSWPRGKTNFDRDGLTTRGVSIMVGGCQTLFPLSGVIPRWRRFAG